MSSILGYYEAKFDMNCQPVVGNKQSGKAINLTMNTEVIVKIYILDLQPKIYPQLESVSDNNTIGNEKLIIRFNQPYLLGNSQLNYKMVSESNSQLSIPLTQSNSQTDTQIKCNTIISKLSNLQGASLTFLWSLINAVQLYEFMPLAQVNTPSFVHEMISQFTISRFDFLPKKEFFESYFDTSHAQAGFFWLVYTMFFIYTWVFLITKYHLLKDSQEDKEIKKFYKDRYSSFYSELKLQRRRNILYYPIFLTHRSIIAYIIIFSNQNFYHQLIAFFCSQLTMVMYLIITRPFKHKVTNIIEIFNETCVLVSIPFLFCFYFYQDDGAKLVIYGWIFVGILVVNVAVNLINAFYQSVIKKIIKLIKKKIWSSNSLNYDKIGQIQAGVGGASKCIHTRATRRRTIQLSVEGNKGQCLTIGQFKQYTLWVTIRTQTATIAPSIFNKE
eukprot:403344162